MSGLSVLCPTAFWVALLCLSISVSAHRWGDFDPLDAHGGIFRALPWSSRELNEVSVMHARGDYRQVLHLIKEKLISSDLSPAERKPIERFLLDRRPPRAFDNLFDGLQRIEIDILHESGDVAGVLMVWKTAIARLPEAVRDVIVRYITTN